MNVLTKPNFSRQTRERVKVASRAFGVQEGEFVKRAVLYFLERVKNMTNLNQEFGEWEQLSDEALMNLESSLSK